MKNRNKSTIGVVLNTCDNGLIGYNLSIHEGDCKEWLSSKPDY